MDSSYKSASFYIYSYSRLSDSKIIDRKLKKIVKDEMGSYAIKIKSVKPPEGIGAGPGEELTGIIAKLLDYWNLIILPIRSLIYIFKSKFIKTAYSERPEITFAISLENNERFEEDEVTDLGEAFCEFYLICAQTVKRISNEFSAYRLSGSLSIKFTEYEFIVSANIYDKKLSGYKLGLLLKHFSKLEDIVPSEQEKILLHYSWAKFGLLKQSRSNFTMLENVYLPEGKIKDYYYFS